jgi:uncharacterized protein YndB with AHSA1/START domain
VIRSEETITIARPPADVFRFLDDEANTPKWMSRCVWLKRVTAGDAGLGTKLRYAYKEPGRQGEMDGEITVYEPDRRLTLRFHDDALVVTVAFELSASGAGTEVRQRVEVEPKTVMMKLMTPVIRGAVRAQTKEEIRGLKREMERG